MRSKFWNWAMDEASGERMLMLNGVISDEAWMENAVTPDLFRRKLEKCGDVTVWINSPGGGVFAAAQIYNMLMEHKGNVRVRIDGLAASAATIVAMAGDTVEISPVGCMFVHNPESLSVGNADDHRMAIGMLEEVKESIVNAYEIKTGLSRQQLSDLMDRSQWMCAQKAVDLGFADRILYWGEDGDGASGSVSNDVRRMLRPLAGALGAFFDGQGKADDSGSRIPAAIFRKRLGIIAH